MSSHVQYYKSEQSRVDHPDELRMPYDADDIVVPRFHLLPTGDVCAVLMFNWHLQRSECVCFCVTFTASVDVVHLRKVRRDDIPII